MRFMRGFSEIIETKTSIAPQVLVAAGTTNGSVVSRADRLGAKLVFNVGTMTGTNAAVSLALQTGELSNGSDMTQAYDSNGVAYTLPAVTAATADQEININYSGFGEYVRVVLVATGSGTLAIPVHCTMIQGGAQYDAIDTLAVR
jgi:hypothetical protein